MNFTSKIKKWVAALSISIIVFIGLAYTPDYFEISKNLDIFNAIYRELNVSYVDGTKPGQLMKTGIDAMLKSLDPYTIYYTENDIEDFRYTTTGEYGGIGAMVTDINGKIIIAEPYEGFSAFKSGIRAGDQIIGVNNINLEGKRSDEISNLLKGQAGSSLKLKLIKAGQNTPIEIILKREEIKTKSVPYFGVLPNSETGYIKLTAFTENCSNEVKEALQALKNKNCKNIILDLKGNLGGLLIEAVNIVNLFVDKGQEIVYTKGKTSNWDKSYLSVNNPIDIKIPLAVLVDENSASASEIVSGALQDLDRAIIIGKRTYGKGLVQQTKPLVYNSQIKITVAKYYIPSGRCVQALDYSNKNEDGRVEKVSDSLITAFKTKRGRIVYDGAGVMPDIKSTEVKPKTVLISLLSKFHIFNYATNYVLKTPNINSASNFTLTDNDYNEFMTFIKTQDYSYKSNIEIDLEKLKKQAEEEQSFDVIKSEYEALLNKLMQDKKDDLIKYKSEICKELETEIVSRYYFEKGRIESNIKNDNDIKQAKSVLSDNFKTEAILTKIEKPTKPFNIKKKF